MNGIDERRELRHRLMTAAIRMRRINMTSALDGMLHSEYMILHKIYYFIQNHPEAKGIYVSELAEGLFMAPSAVSRLLSSMEGKGFIVREVDPKDRRNTYVSLSDQGESLRIKTSESMRKVLDRVIDRMGEEAICRLIDLWNQIAETIQDEMEKFEPTAAEKENRKSEE